jgi:nicotinate-nucleotide adenylyltransferase
MKIRTGVFSGSFNPIHIGHLALANYLCEYGFLDEVWFLVTPHNPLKDETGLWDDDFRLELTQLAVGDYPKFKVSDFEFHLPRPSYTVHTLAALKKAYPEHDFTLIIGSDNWEIFPQWFQPETIIEQFSILIYPRLGYPIDASSLPDSVQLVDAPIFDISSTEIRKALDEGKDVRYFLHPNVYQCICDKMKNND